jgi:rhodanese-related sulfurtransferase
LKNGSRNFKESSLPRSSQATILTCGRKHSSINLNSAPRFEKGESMDELEITPADVKARMERGEKLVLIDVREPWEHQLCRIEGAKLVPLGSLAASLQTLPDVDEVICYCHHGMRSLDAAAWLRFQGIEKAKSLAGGIERWSLEVDPKVPRY